MQPGLVQIVAASFLGAGSAANLALAAGLAAVLALLFWLVLVSRRRMAREIGAIVAALEELRTGSAGEPPALRPGSPLARVSDAVRRLAHDLQAQQAELETSTARWRALSDAAQQTAIITTDADGDLRTLSLGASALLGWEEDEVLGQPVAILFEENAFKELLPKLARRSRLQQGVTTRSAMLRRDGTKLDAEVSVRVIGEATDTGPGYMIVVRDLREQVQLEGELRESETRYRGLVDRLAEGVLIVQGGQIAYLNPAASDLLGGSPGDLTGIFLRERVATRDVMVVEEMLAAIVKQPEAALEVTCSLVTSEGAPSAEVRIKAKASEHGGQPAAMLLVQDQTPERRIEAELRRNEARLDAVLEAASDGIVVLSDARNGSLVQMTNQAFAQLFALPMERILGITETRLSELLRERGGAAGELARMLSSAGGVTTKEIVALPDASPTELLVRVAPLTSRTGEELGRVLLCRDLTEQRRSERQLQAQAERLQLGKMELEKAYERLNDANRQLHAHSQEVDRLNQELRRLDEMKSNLLGNVSHELQTPLVSIRGYTEMTLKERLGPLTEEQRHGLTLSLKNIDRLIAMIDNLLAFHRTGPELREMTLSRFKLRPLVQEAADLLQEGLQAKGLELRIEIESGDLDLHADRDKVLQVFLNLLSNAIKYNRQGGEIRLAAAHGQPGFATVRLRDTGPGIAPEELGRIFDRHYRVRSDAGPVPEGSGIGLAIVRDILRLHGCTIHAESERGKGAEFVFTLPLSRDRDERADEPPRTTFEPPQETAHPHSTVQESTSPAGSARRPRFRIIRRTRANG